MAEQTSSVVMNQVLFEGIQVAVAAGGTGGAIGVTSSSLSVTNSMFRSNQAAAGGAISISASIVSLAYTDFSSNNASSDGGAISCTGSAVSDLQNYNARWLIREA